METGIETGIKFLKVPPNFGCKTLTLKELNNRQLSHIDIKYSR